MLRRIIYGALFAIVILGLLTVFLLQRFSRITPIDIWQAVPRDAILYLEEVDYEYLSGSFFPKNRIWIDFVNTTGKTHLDSAVSAIITRINSVEAIREILTDEGFNFSIHLLGKDQLMPLFYIQYAEIHSDHDFEQVMLSLLEGESMVNDRKYEAETLYDVSGEPGHIPGRFTFSCINGICLVSPSSILVEESVRTIHADDDLSGDQLLRMIRETAGRYVHANIYINYEKLNLLFYPFIKEVSWNVLEILTRLATWGELDLDLKDEAVILHGMTRAEDEGPLILEALSGQSPVRIQVHEMMPAGTASFLHLGISDKERFHQEMNEYLKNSGEWAEVNKEMERIDQLYGIDPLTDLLEILDDEMAWFAIEGVTGSKEEEVLLIETRSESETREVVMHWIEQYLQDNAFDMRTLLHVYQLDDQTSFNIYRLPDPFFRQQLPGRLFNQYFTILGNHLIFGPSVEVISRVIYQNVLHKTFISDQVFKEMSDYLSNRSNITIFLRPYPYMDYKSDLLTSSLISQMDQTEIFLRRIPGLVIQFSSEGDMFYQSISCKYTSQIKEKALTVWESLLDSTAVIKPSLVLNHNTSEKEIFIQDASRKIYLINSTGRILWSQRLDGAIMGEVYQVDFYKNGKLQYLFNTADRIHLIDRNGNYVERYPVSLRSAATNPLALFDYENRKDYRLFLAGEDRRIYVYNKEGNVVTGWGFGKTEGRVTRMIQHFRIGDRDYIVAADDKRTYFLDRKGRERIRPDKRIVVSENNLLTLDMNIREEKPRWVCTDTAGNVISFYQDGSVSLLLEQDLTSDHFFLMQDMDVDGIPEYILADGDELSVLHQDGNRLFSFRVRDRISSMPDIYKFSASDIKIGITDRSRNRIYLVNSDGSLYEGFPLEGSTRFSIGYFAGSDSRFNLIVGSANNFLYNYSIE